MKSKTQTVWVVTGHSESGDDYGPFVYYTNPCEEELKKLVCDEMDWSYDNSGPGIFGSYTHVKVTEAEVRADLHKPVFVGEGLKERTYEECLQEGLNPNPNPPGAIYLPTDRGAMEAHIKKSMKELFKALKS